MPVPKEILPDMSEMISGCERGEESPRRECDNCPARRIAPRNSLQLTASASNAPTDNPPPTTEAKLHQEDFFPANFHLPPERPKPPEAPEKDALPLLHPFFRPRWEEEEEGLVIQSLLLRTTGETPSRSAEEADEGPALDGPAKDFQGIFRDATSAEQERRSKPRASWSGQNPVKEWKGGKVSIM